MTSDPNNESRQDSESRHVAVRNPSVGAKGSIVIVGGGVIGISCAWYLHRDGWNVTIMDRANIGGACSYGNCGLVCPSHVLPLTEPGAFKDALASLFRPNSPLRVKPQLNPRLWLWMLKFAQRCNRQSMLTAAEGIQAMLVSGMAEYHKLMEQDAFDCEWVEQGLLFAYQTQRALDDYASTNQLLTDRFNEAATYLNGQQLTELEPALKEKLAGAWYYEHDAHLRPNRLVQVMRSRLEDEGVLFLEQTEPRLISGTGSTATSVVTNKETLAADAFLFACGAWTPMMSEYLGCRIPIQPGKGYSMTFERPAICPNIPVIFPEHRVAVTPMRSCLRLGSIMEFAGYDESLRPERLRLLTDGASHYLRQLPDTLPQETWYGWRPMTYDSLPVIDVSPRWNNVWIAAGHNMLGLSMAPATGRLISELVAQQHPHIDPKPYSLSRF
jgi:D-amino-acid dehydrogenase